ncbi:hypothetical protein BCR34DRAFT_316652 [Clohesyomyces aquaticus]|uniref:Uncharacterized protein n=1 Tax=Clohesyomyces aquaticus TaxID=1231657 RepID=A0A1Y1ZPH0_9PLEO|nr:hypothetical protein BCR34DRAFT_316652 [Clohesyomyces aquaticus]
MFSFSVKKRSMRGSLGQLWVTVGRAAVASILCICQASLCASVGRDDARSVAGRVAAMVADSGTTLILRIYPLQSARIGLRRGACRRLDSSRLQDAAQGHACQDPLARDRARRR